MSKEVSTDTYFYARPYGQKVKVRKVSIALYYEEDKPLILDVRKHEMDREYMELKFTGIGSIVMSNRFIFRVSSKQVDLIKNRGKLKCLSVIDDNLHNQEVEDYYYIEDNKLYISTRK